MITRPALPEKQTPAERSPSADYLPEPTTWWLKKMIRENYLQPATINGQLVAFKPVGIYQNADQVNHGPLRCIPLSIGDFMYLDVNADSGHELQ